MKLMQWEAKLVEAIHRYGGFVSDEFVEEFFLENRDPNKLPPTNNNYVRRRKRLMRQARILRQVQPDGVKGFILGIEGARRLAAREGKTLSGKDKFLYRRKVPRYVHHEWREAQVHIQLEKACHLHKRVKLHSYRHDLELRLFPVKVYCYDPDRKEHYSREIVPDSLIDIDFRMRPYSLPVEIDMGTKFDPNVTKHKLIPHMFYHRADTNRFWGRSPNCWIWITTSRLRLEHLKQKTEATAKALGKPNLASHLVWTTWHDFTFSNIFKQPIWLQGGRAEADYLFSCCDYAANM
jgi:hypothetical protein